MAAPAASSTENAAILVIGDSLALYNPPTRVAEELAYLDCLSDGRLIAGFVFGTPMDSTFSYGIPPVELRDRFHEARDLILRAWTEPEPFAFNGRWTKLRYVNLWPRPVQARPPIWIPGSGSVETWDLVTDESYCYGHLSFSGLRSAKPIVDGYWYHVEARGGDLNPHRMAFTQRSAAWPTATRRPNGSTPTPCATSTRTTPRPPGFLTPPGYTSTASAQAQPAAGHGRHLEPEDRRQGRQRRAQLLGVRRAGLHHRRHPRTGQQRLRDLATELRVGQLIACLHMGDLAEEVAAMNTQLFGTGVIPYLRDLWADQPDHWTPATSQARVAAAAAAERTTAGAPALGG